MGPEDEVLDDIGDIDLDFDDSQISDDALYPDDDELVGAEDSEDDANYEDNNGSDDIEGIDEEFNFSDDSIEETSESAEDSQVNMASGFNIGNSEELSDEELDAKIEALKTAVESDRSSAGVIDKNELMDDMPEQNNVSRGNTDFLSDTGDFVLMDSYDDGDTFELKYIDIENIAVTKRIRASKSVEDLVKSIKSTGLLKPIDVAPTSAEGVYVLLDGYRRILACARAGKRRMPCVVNKKVTAPEIPLLEAMHNQQKRYSIPEQIDYIEYLEKEKGIMSASMIEYLLQMNSGEYTKLKDILNDNDEDIVSKLMDGQLTIEAAFKKLEQRRKKESAEERDLRKATKAYDESDDMDDIAKQGELGDAASALSESELGNLAVNATNIDDANEESFEDLVEAGNIEGFKPHKQDPKYRERLDPTLRKQVLARDHNTCRICEEVSGMEFVEVLDVHHIQEVYLGGDDSIDNLITACTVCHKLVHLYGRGELNIRPISEFSEKEQNRFKKIVKLGNKIRTDMKLKGMKLDQLKKVDNAGTIGRTKPGESQTAG